MSSTSITEAQLNTALRTFLMGVAGSGWQVVKAQGNRVAMPTGSFIAMTSMTKPILSTSKASWIDPGTNPGTENNLTSRGWRCQLDVYGPGAEDMALMISSLIRTEYACDQFQQSGVDMQPLYSEEPRNTTLINAEQQYEERWTFDVHAQFNPIVTTPLDFADELLAGIVEVDTTFR